MSPLLPRLLAFDLDGTLLPAEKRITAHTRRVLDAMRDLGCHLTLATGKFHHLALGYGEDLRLDVPQVSLDGATVGGNGHDEVKRCISAALARQLLDAYQDEALHSFADNGADIMLLRSKASTFRTATQFWAAEFRHVDDLRQHLDSDPAIVSFYGGKTAMARIVADVTSRHPELRVSEYWSPFLGCQRISFQPQGVDKGSGVLGVARQLGIEPAECMVFGDWLNDLPMFEIGAVGVAMSNAVGEVHAASTYVTDHSCEDDGVARFLESHFL